MQHLALQIAEIDGIEIDQPDAANAGRREIQAQWRAKTARADQQHAGSLQAFLPLDANFGHD